MKITIIIRMIIVILFYVDNIISKQCNNLTYGSHLRNIYKKIPSGKGSYLKAMVLLPMRRNLSLLSEGDQILKELPILKVYLVPLSSYSNIGLLH